MFDDISLLPCTKRSDDDIDDVRKAADEFIKSDKVVMFSKTWCEFCMDTKAIIKEIYPDFRKFEINKLEDNKANEIQQYLLELTGDSTVPRVFINQQFIGGASEIYQLNKDNKLQDLIGDSGSDSDTD